MYYHYYNTDRVKFIDIIVVTPYHDVNVWEGWGGGGGGGCGGGGGGERYYGLVTYPSTCPCSTSCKLFINYFNVHVYSDQMLDYKV